MQRLNLVLSIASVVCLARPAAADVDFAKDVKPILETNCLKCHNPEKAKGKLRMDTRENFMKGSENGPVVMAGKPEGSTLFKLINQPKTSEDRMPPEGEPLKKEQIATLEKWIKEGAKWPDGVALKLGGAAAAVPTSVAPKDDPGVPITDAEKAAVAKLQGAGVLAIRLAQNTNLLRVDFSLRGKEIKDDELVSLKEMPNLTELNLGGTIVTDASLTHLKPLTNLTRLGLQNTKITDAGLANLSAMTKLASLNVYGTGVTDAGLASLGGMKSLKHLYVWQTKVTAEGAKKIGGAISGLDVERGYEAPPPPPADPVKPKDAPKKPEEKKPAEKKPEEKKPEEKKKP
jgi:hypothetical protein